MSSGTAPARAIEDRRHAAATPGAEAPDSIALWADILETLLGDLGLPHAGLLVHFHAGSPSDEAFEVTRRELPAGHDLAGSLAAIREDEATIWTRRMRG